MQMRRQQWTCLNGEWSFCFDPKDSFNHPEQISKWTHKIQVPFAPESELSGVTDTGFHNTCWYQREVEILKVESKRTLLHFGAVDYSARVWVNGKFVGCHEGGHTPFHFDITDLLDASGKQTISVVANDDPVDLAKPRGKQDWQLEPHSIWYPRTSGIWQTVWVEQVPETYIDWIRWEPHLERWEIGCEAFLAGNKKTGLKLSVRLSVGEQLLANDTYEVISGEIHRRIALSDPGIDDFRNELLWSPEKPTLIQATIQLWDGNTLVDEVESYTALRSVGVQKGRFLLNGRPYFLRLVLDQGYWEDSLMTPPSEAAIQRDINLTKSAGFNGVRKHQKIEDPSFLYWADVLGLLVWEEMPSAYRFTTKSVQRLTREWMEVIQRDYNHPCIAVWVPFNESWGVPDLAQKTAHQDCVQALYHLTKTLDPQRPVIGNDGWESSATDILGIHDYDHDPMRLRTKYGTDLPINDIINTRRPAGRLLALEGYAHSGQPVMLTEFGGVKYLPESKGQISWGYSESKTAEEFRAKYTDLLLAANQIELFAGFCYTQLTDTFQEANGIFFMDRTPKFPITQIRNATLGSGHTRGELTAAPVDQFNVDQISIILPK
ncbi:MAG: glycoside hydrolase family 2 TIM barrel-domain containing protein [Bdellovibrionota bacterium]